MNFRIMSNRDRIKSKILKKGKKHWWGDDFDSRFLLISKIKHLENQIILDVGGGIGIISDELRSNNIIINLDMSKEDLEVCLKNTENKIHNICGIMNKIPLKSDYFDYVISGSVLQYAKIQDINKDKHYRKNGQYEYPSVEETMQEINRVLKKNGKLLLVTPNNRYYKSVMLEYDELKNTISNHFSNYSLFCYNTFPRLSKKYRKLNLTSIVPKILSKIKNPDDIINSLIKNSKKNSVSFYVEAKK